MVLDTIRTPRIPRRTDAWCPPLRKTQGWGSLKLWSALEPKRRVGQPPILLVPLFPAANTPFLRAAVSYAAAPGKTESPASARWLRIAVPSAASLRETETKVLSSFLL